MLRRALVRLTSLSFAYPDVSASDRGAILEPQVTAEGVDVFVLATCLRVELAWTGGPELAPTLLEQIYGQRSLPAAKMRTDFDAFHHLSRVAAGLESAQVGEAEVLAQFRQAMEQLAGHTGADGELVGTVETALGVARAARRSLSDPQDGSLAVAAARMLGDVSEVVVLGGGAMGRAVVRDLDPSKVKVYSRRSDPVAGIAVHPWQELYSVLTTCSAVVSTIPGPVPVLQGLQRSEGNPLLLVDLGMPPAMERYDQSAVMYHGIDDVASSVPPVTEPEADETVAIDSENAWRRLSVTRDAKSIISSVVDLVEQIVDDEVRRFAHRFATAEEPEQVLRQLAHGVSRRIIHPSVSLLGSTPLTPADLDVMAKAFGVDRD